MNAPSVVVPTSLPRCLTSGSLRRGWVYCIRDDASEAVKIGFSNNPARRFKQIQTANPNRLRFVAAMEAVEAFEQFLHWSHRARRMSGEWFDDRDAGVSSVFAAMALPEGAA